MTVLKRILRNIRKKTKRGIIKSQRKSQEKVAGASVWSLSIWKARLKEVSGTVRKKKKHKKKSKRHNNERREKCPCSPAVITIDTDSDNGVDNRVIQASNSNMDNSPNKATHDPAEPDSLNISS